MYSLSIDGAKEQLKLLQADLKKVKSGSRRSHYIGEHIIDIHPYMINQYKNFHIKFIAEHARANSVMMNRESLKATGIFSDKKIDKETQQKVDAWTDSAYPKITEDIWDIEYDMELLLNFIKQSSEI